MLRLWPLLSATVLLAVLATACGGGEDEGTNEEPSPTVAPTPQAFPERPEITISPDDELTAVVETVKGSFTIRLRPDLALETVNSFVFLAQQGYFDGVTFHRVIRGDPTKPDFVAQGGDPTGTGSGGPGYNLPDEFSETTFERGTVAMANTGAPNSSGSQFFITYNGDYDSVLRGRYTVFGEVVEGMGAVDSLTPRDPSVDPSTPPGDAIISVTIKEG